MNRSSDINAAHPYPCKYPAESIRQFLKAPAGVLLDPFCGSGTTVLEGAINGWQHVYGFDSNPIAVLITKFKTLRVDERLFADCESALGAFVLNANVSQDQSKLDFDGATHWFAKHVLNDLGTIVAWINKNQDRRVRTWLRLSLSRIINRVSRQDSETRYVAIDRNIKKGETLERFAQSARSTLDLLRDRPALKSDVSVAAADIQHGIPLPDSSVDRIVTSPPYANTMDYYLYHKQRMNILGFDFKRTQQMEIGSRHEYSSLRAPASKWRNDYLDCLREFRRVLKSGGEAIIVIGDSQIAGTKVDAADLTMSLSKELGMDCVVLESVPLSGRSRSFSRGFQRPNKFEHVLRLTNRQPETNRQSKKAVLVVSVAGGS